MSIDAPHQNSGFHASHSGQGACAGSSHFGSMEKVFDRERHTAPRGPERCASVMERHQDGPFFCYVPFNAPHYPNPVNKAAGEPAIWQAPDSYFQMLGSDPETLDERQRHHAVLVGLDTAIGRIVQKLDNLGLREGSIVVVLSDNGAFMLPLRGLECASNRPLKGGGATVYEGGVRVPCVIRWPGRLPEGTVCRKALSSMDLLPMAILAAGGKPPGDRVLDGRDPTTALAGEAESPHESLVFRYKFGSAIRMGQNKLIRRSDGAPWQRFELERDIGETANLAERRPDVVKRLSEEFARREAVRLG